MRQSPAQTTPHHAAMLMRGGRMTKWKGIVASMAPMMGSVSHLAVMALPVMLAAAPAAAQCTASGAVLTCSGAVTTPTDIGGASINEIVLDQSFSANIESGSGFFGTHTGGSLSLTQAEGGGDLIAGMRAIGITKNGTGDLTITTTGAVSGGQTQGIYARQTAGNLTISSSGTVTGNDYGIRALQAGTGTVGVTATALVTANTGVGVSVQSELGAGDVTVSVADVTATDNGVAIQRNGNGAVTLTASGTVSSREAYGVNVVTNRDTTGDVTLNLADVDGYYGGVRITRSGSGAVQITSSGAITSDYGDGINVRGIAGAGAVTINVADVTGYNRGINADNQAGDVTITASGTVTSEYSQGVSAVVRSLYDGESAGDVTITVGAVDAYNTGVFGRNYSTGNLTITTNGTITTANEGAYGTGIRSESRGGDTVITTNGDISDVRFGIQATGRSGGGVSITANGDITARMTAMYLYAYDDATSNVTISGNVMGGYGGGVVTYGYANGASVTITSSGALGATSGVAFRDDSGNYSDTANTASQLVVAGALNGDALMGAGADRVELQRGARLGTGGAALDGFVVLNGDSADRRSLEPDRDGFDGFIMLDSVMPLNDLSRDVETDVLAFNGWVGTIDAAQILGFEEITLDGAADVTFTDTIAAGTRLANIVDDGEDSVLELIVGPQAMARFAATMTIAGDVTNNGGLDLRGATPGNVLTVTGDYAAASDLFIGVVLGGDNSAADRLTVMGDTSGTTNVFVTNRGGVGAQTENGIRVVEVAGTSAGQFVLANGTAKTKNGQSAVRAGSFIYALQQVGNDWYLLSEEAAVVSAAFEILPLALQTLLPAQSLAQRLSGRQISSGASFGSAVRPPANSDITVSTRGSDSAPMVDGAWVNISGATLDVTPQNATSVTAIAQDSWRVDSGVDLPLMQSDQGVLTGAISVFAGQSTLDATAGADTGRVKSQSQGIGLAATWRGDNGLYGDVRYEQGWLTSDLSQTTTGVVAADVKSLGRLASVEVGRGYGWRDALTLTPQAQLTWAQVKTDDAAIASSDSETLTARLGLAAEHGWTLENGAAARLFGAVDVSHVLDNQASISVDGSDFNTQMPDTTAALALGGAVDLRTDAGLMSVYGQISGTRALDTGKADGLAGGLGLRWQW